MKPQFEEKYWNEKQQQIQITTTKNGANSPRWNNIFGQLITALFHSVSRSV